jgi:ribosomal 30S subunit maturation factor RimM
MIPQDRKDPTLEVTYPLSINETLKEVIGSVRRQVLCEFIKELMLVLQSENYLIHEIVTCLANFFESEGLDEVAECLDEGAENLLNIHRKSRTEERSIPTEES